MSQQVAGKFKFSIDGVAIPMAGPMTYNEGADKREMLVGPTGVQDFKSMPQIPFCEGSARRTAELDVKWLKSRTNSTGMLELPNGDIFMLRGAVYTSEGDGDTDEGVVAFRFEGSSGDLIPA